MDPLRFSSELNHSEGWIEELTTRANSLSNNKTEKKINELPLNKIIGGYKEFVESTIDSNGGSKVERSQANQPRELISKIRLICHSKILYFKTHRFSEFLSKVNNFFRCGKFESSAQMGLELAAKSEKHLKREVLPLPELKLDNQMSVAFNPANGKFTMISKAPPVKNVVISGGGAKGVVLPGFIKAMEEHQTEEGCSFRDQLENIAGSSVGALTSALIATGVPADEMIQSSKNFDFKALLGERKGVISKDGEPLTKYVRENAVKNIKSYLQKQIGDGLSEGNLGKLNLGEEDLKKIKELLVELKKESGDKVHITFSMLDTLHRLEPKLFKTMTVTATCRETGETFYFDAKNTPNLDIAIACRASASLPLLLVPVVIPRKFLSPGYNNLAQDMGALSFVDGGYLDNVPIQSMEEKQKGQIRGVKGQNLQTLVLVFDETKRAEGTQSPYYEANVKEHTLYDSSKLTERLVRDLFTKSFGRIKTEKRNTLTKEKGLVAAQENYTQRNIAFRVKLEGEKGISTRDFDEAQKNATKYMELGYLQGMEYLWNHQGELIARTYDTFDEVLEQIPQESIDGKMKNDIETFRKSIGAVGFSPGTNGKHDYGTYQKKNGDTGELKEKSKDYSRNAEERIRAARLEELKQPKTNAFVKLLEKSEILDLEEVVTAFQSQCKIEIREEKSDFVAGIFDDALNEIYTKVENRTFSPEQGVEELKRRLKEKIEVGKEETLTFNKELFKELVGDKVKGGKGWGAAKNFPIWNPEVQKLIQAFNNDTWVEGERELKYKNIENVENMNGKLDHFFSEDGDLNKILIRLFSEIIAPPNT